MGMKLDSLLVFSVYVEITERCPPVQVLLDMISSHRGFDIQGFRVFFSGSFIEWH
jgi:hypothetical protein